MFSREKSALDKSRAGGPSTFSRLRARVQDSSAPTPRRPIETRLPGRLRVTLIPLLWSTRSTRHEPLFLRVTTTSCVLLCPPFVAAPFSPPSLADVHTCITRKFFKASHDQGRSSFLTSNSPQISFDLRETDPRIRNTYSAYTRALNRNLDSLVAKSTHRSAHWCSVYTVEKIRERTGLHISTSGYWPTSRSQEQSRFCKAFNLNPTLTRESRSSDRVLFQMTFSVLGTTCEAGMLFQKSIQSVHHPFLRLDRFVLDSLQPCWK